MSISLLQEAWDALSPNQVLVTLLFAENYTFPDKLRKKIFHLNSMLVKFYFENDVIFLNNIFLLYFWLLIHVAKTFFGHWWAQEKRTIFYLNFKFVKFYIEEDDMFLGIFYAVIDVCF